MYKVLLLDDEEPARELLHSYVQKIAQLEIVGKVGSAMEAKQVLEVEQVDLLLSDIHMEDFSGIELVKLLKNPPVIIFTTAYAEYALEGFELNVADYLVKPIPFPRFTQAIDRAIELLSLRRQQEDKTPQTSSTYIFVRTNRKMVKVVFADILFVESYGEYVKIHTDDDVILALQRTSTMEEILPIADFVRIHRSYIVNLNHIQEIDGATVVLSGGHRLVASKRMKESFLQVLGRKGII